MSIKKPLVLLIDDDLDLREVLEIVLLDNDLDMVAVSNGQLALDYLLSPNPDPDVILLDLMMPVMDGATFRSIQLGYPKLSRIPTIVMSASAKLQSEYNNTVYIPKPFDVYTLLKEIWLAVDRKH